MKAKIRGMEQFDRRTQAAIVEVAKKEIDENLEKLLIGMLEVFLWGLRREFGFGPDRLRRVIRRIMSDYDEARERYEIGEYKKPLSAAKKRRMLSMSYQQLVHERIIEYGVDVRAEMEGRDGLVYAEPTEGRK